MKIWTDRKTYNFNDKLLAETFTEQSLFFDIETTGFSPAYTQIYMIGCGMRDGNDVVIKQFFAEKKEEEADILMAFFTLLESYDTIITFNGIGFDIPYIKAKCDSLSLEEHFSKKKYIDIFKIISSYKFLLKLPSYKQKSLEDFLGLKREDKFDGGELINVYKEYQKQPTEDSLFLLKQHNYDDVLGMIDLLPGLSYHHFFEGGYTITELKSNEFTTVEGLSQKELIFTLKNDVAIPRRVSYGYEEFYLICNDSESKLSIRLFDGELKFFHDNYKEYFYLPTEDTAIHKSISSFVEKKHRKQATAATCYTKKDSIFLPQYETVLEPFFKENYKDKKSYFELTEDFITSDSIKHKYVSHILTLMKKQKR